MSEINDRQHEIDRRARLLQSEGPDEYPWGYYLHLAARQIDENVAVADRWKPEDADSPIGAVIREIYGPTIDRIITEMEESDYLWPRMVREIWPDRDPAILTQVDHALLDAAKEFEERGDIGTPYGPSVPEWLRGIVRRRSGMIDEREGRK